MLLLNTASIIVYWGFKLVGLVMEGVSSNSGFLQNVMIHFLGYQILLTRAVAQSFVPQIGDFSVNLYFREVIKFQFVQTT